MSKNGWHGRILALPRERMGVLARRRPFGDIQGGLEP
jgi:hypothetical protein